MVGLMIGVLRLAMICIAVSIGLEHVEVSGCHIGGEALGTCRGDTWAGIGSKVEVILAVVILAVVILVWVLAQDSAEYLWDRTKGSLD
jgi:hypothetical protein